MSEFKFKIGDVVLMQHCQLSPDARYRVTGRNRSETVGTSDERITTTDTYRCAPMDGSGSDIKGVPESALCLAPADEDCDMQEPGELEDLIFKFKIGDTVRIIDEHRRPFDGDNRYTVFSRAYAEVKDEEPCNLYTLIPVGRGEQQAAKECCLEKVDVKSPPTVQPQCVSIAYGAVAVVLPGGKFTPPEVEQMKSELSLVVSRAIRTHLMQQR